MMRKTKASLGYLAITKPNKKEPKDLGMAIK